MITCNCENQFDSILNYVNHLRTHHKNVSIFQCVLANCHRRFSNLESYRYHLNTHETIDMNNLDLSINLAEPETFDVNYLDLNINLAEPVNTNFNIQNDLNINLEEPANTDFNIQPNLIVFDNTDLPTQINNMKYRFLKMVIGIYNENEFSRKKILVYLKQTISMFKENLNILLNIFEKSTVDNNIKNEVKHLIQEFSISSAIQSEYLFFKKINELGYFAYPQTVILNTKTEIKTVNNIPKIVNTKITIQTINLTELFGKLFNNTNMLLDIYNNMEDILNHSNTGYISNIIQTDHWKNIVRLLDSTTTLYLPLFVYFDDFETNNPLGSRSKIKKVGGVYYTVQLA